MSRKDEHVTYALENYNNKATNDFDQMKLIHHSLRSVDLGDVSIQTKIGSIQLETPFFINAMTGGSEWTKDINGKLAYVAKKLGLAIAVGSMSSAMKNESLWDSFMVVKDLYPEGIIFANLSPNFTPIEAQRAIDKLGASALQIHLNAAQEIVMSEGDRVFSHWPTTIESLVRNVKTDIIVKEVGFGMSRETIEELLDYKVKIIDVSGRGGTNFIRIENDRRKDSKLSYLNDWGQSTVQSLLEAHPYRDDVDIIASGGIRNPLDMIKSFVLGAKAIGISGVILHSIMNDGVESTILMLENWRDEIKLLMSLLGAKTISDLTNCDFVLSGDLLDYSMNRRMKIGK